MAVDFAIVLPLVHILAATLSIKISPNMEPQIEQSPARDHLKSIPKIPCKFEPLSSGCKSGCKSVNLVVNLVLTSNANVEGRNFVPAPF